MADIPVAATPPILASDRAADALHIHLLGGFRVRVGERIVGDDAWRLRKARGVVKLLALAPGYALASEQVMEALWPDLALDAAANNLRLALHTARQAIDPHAPVNQYLRRDGDRLVLRAPGGVGVDVDAFTVAARAAMRSADPAAYWGAVEHYAGDLLPDDLFEDWAADRRRALHDQYLGLLLALAALHEERVEFRDAIDALHRVIAIEPASETAHRHLMRLHAQTGQTDQALRQYHQLREVLQRDLDAGPDAASEQLYEAIKASREATPTPIAHRPDPVGFERPSWRSGGYLPASVTSFIGRADALVEVQRLLTETRLVTLTGTGGVGKTRLALEVARAVTADFPDGVWLVELAALGDPLDVPRALARVLGVVEQPGRALIETLATRLGDAVTLVVLDNCEHVVAACAELSEALLRACPALRILTTSRELLGIGPETLWRVPSLEVPILANLPPLAELTEIEAVRLFVERARSADPNFKVTDRSARAVVHICQRLDGIPLAIELAAARVRALSVEQIAARLDDCFGLLTGGSRTALPRQQTLRATIDWSHALLSEPERGLLRRLAVFAGGWILEAAEIVGSHDGVEAGAVLDLLARLVDRSLVNVDDTGGEAARYRLLETVRQYAADRLHESGEEAAVHRRHMGWYLALVERAESELDGPAQAIWLDRFAAEHDNLRAALAWSLDHDPPAGLALAASSWAYWRMRGSHVEGHGWLERLLARAPDPTTVRVRAMLAAAFLARMSGDHAAPRWADDALALSRELGDTALIARALYEIGSDGFRGGDYQTARARLEEALPLWRTLGNRVDLAEGLRRLGQLTEVVGDYARAREVLEESVVVNRADGRPELLSRSLRDLSRVALCQGEVAQARALAEEALTIGEQAQMPVALVIARERLGRVACWEGDLAAAARWFEASLVGARAVDFQRGIGWALVGRGQVAVRQGDLAGARAWLAEGLTVCRVVGDGPASAAALHLLGLVAWQAGDAADATTFLTESLVLRRDLGVPIGIAECIEGLAVVAAGTGEPVRATRLLGAAGAIRAAIGAPLPLVERRGYEATLEATRLALGAAAFDTAWTTGAALAVAQAVAEALGD